jgi:hypothetical protein
VLLLSGIMSFSQQALFSPLRVSPIPNRRRCLNTRQVRSERCLSISDPNSLRLCPITPPAGKCHHVNEAGINGLMHVKTIMGLLIIQRGGAANGVNHVFSESSSLTEPVYEIHGTSMATPHATKTGQHLPERVFSTLHPSILSLSGKTWTGSEAVFVPEG